MVMGPFSPFVPARAPVYKAPEGGTQYDESGSDSESEGEVLVGVGTFDHSLADSESESDLAAALDPVQFARPDSDLVI